jgi:hypothetical protein
MRFLDKHSKKISRVFGIIGLAISVYLFVSGGICLLSDSTTKDSEGFYSTWTIQIKRDSYAIILSPDGIDIDGGWEILDLRAIKIEGSNNNPSNQIFIGVAREADIDAYLSGVEYDEITGLRIFPSRTNYQNHTGNMVPGGRPTSQAFWAKSVCGSGTQNLTWEPESDRHSLVLMNEDGSASLDIHLVVRTETALLSIAGVSSLMIGVVMLLLSLPMLFLAGRIRNVVYPEPFELLLQHRMKPKTNN